MRRKQIRGKDDIDSKDEDTDQFWDVVNKGPQKIDEVAEGIKTTGRLSTPKLNKYSTMSTKDQDKVEEEIIGKMINFKWVPIEFSDNIPKDFYDKVFSRWTYALQTKKRMRERSLILAKPDFNVPEINVALQKHKGKFFMKARALKILEGKIQEVDDESRNIWTKTLSPLEKIEATSPAVDTEPYLPSIQVREPINVEDEPIHIFDTEKPEEETYVEDFITIAKNVIEEIPEMLKTLGGEEFFIEDITEGDANNEAKEDEVITIATKNLE